MSTPSSPVSQLLKSLGISRNDLQQRSSEMRAFLGTDSSFVASSSSPTRPSPSSNLPTPTTPVPPTPAQVRKFNSMDEVMERKSRQCRKERKLKLQQKTRSTQPPSPTPSTTASPKRVYIDDRSSVPDHFLKYYREHTLDSMSSMPSTSSPSRSTPARLERQQSAPSSFYSQQVHAILASQAPVTPRKTRPETIDLTSPLPPSSPPVYTPQSSPVKPIVNLVSSPPRPLPPPPALDAVTLPYTLPPPPYSLEKPNKPYAALIGQAILSSQQHRLTLQEIYDYMSTVWPYFKRRIDGGTTTWMNSVRHVLSTTTVFRKCVRERRVGRSLWAIWDEDVECFEGGNYKKKGSQTYVLPPSPVKPSAAEAQGSKSASAKPSQHVKTTGSEELDSTPTKPKRGLKRSATTSDVAKVPKQEPTLPSLGPLPPGFQIPTLTHTADGTPAFLVPIIYPPGGAGATGQLPLQPYYALPGSFPSYYRNLYAMQPPPVLASATAAAPSPANAPSSTSSEQTAQADALPPSSPPSSPILPSVEHIKEPQSEPEDLEEDELYSDGVEVNLNSDEEEDPLAFLNFDSPPPVHRASSSSASASALSFSRRSTSPPTSLPLSSASATTSELDVASIFDFDLLESEEDELDQLEVAVAVKQEERDVDEDVRCILSVLEASESLPTLSASLKGKGREVPSPGKKKTGSTPSSILRPVQDWDSPSIRRGSLHSGYDLRSGGSPLKGRGSSSKKISKKLSDLPPTQMSPTLNRKSRRTREASVFQSAASDDDEPLPRMRTPPPRPVPRNHNTCTPTRKRTARPSMDSDDDLGPGPSTAIERPCTPPPRKTSIQHPVSSLRTPVGGSADDDEQAAKFSDQGDDDHDDDRFRTPKRRRVGSASKDRDSMLAGSLLNIPVTPKRGSTSHGGAIPRSPFRTPRTAGRMGTLSASASKSSRKDKDKALHDADADALPVPSSSSRPASSPFRTPGLTPGRGFSSDFTSLFSSGGPFGGITASGGASSFSNAYSSGFGMSSYSPFRTPGRGGGYLDAQEQLAFFHDELGKSYGEGSPISQSERGLGLFGKDKGGFRLYESPTGTEFLTKKYW